MKLFFDPSIDLTKDKHILSEEESKHICKVLRMKEGDFIYLLNGKGALVKVQIEFANPKQCTVKIIDIISEKEPNYSIHIAIAPTKMMDRIEWFLEKATEIGITEITPILCENSERKQLKDERLEKIIISAVKQSKRLYLPKLNPLTDLKTFLKNNPKGLIAHCEDGKKNSIVSSFQQLNCPIIIGPEGDFSSKEIELAKSLGYTPITLGKNRLRTETAGLYAVMQTKLIVDQL